MLLLTLRDGTSLSLDLGEPGDRAAWAARSSDPTFPATVTSISLVVGGQRADLPVPRRFRALAFEAGVERDPEGRPVAERVAALADDVVLSLTAYVNGRSGRFRVDLDRRGRARFRPPSFP